jgi:hypothetical protein
MNLLDPERMGCALSTLDGLPRGKIKSIQIQRKRFNAEGDSGHCRHHFSTN